MMIKRLLLTLLAILALFGCSKPDATPIELVRKVIIVYEHKDPLGRFIIWQEGADISTDKPAYIHTIKDFTYEEGYRYTLPVRIQIEKGEEIYSYFEWGDHKLTKQKIIDGGARQ